MKNLHEKVLATDLIFLSAIKKKEVISVSLHHLTKIILIDSLKFYEHLLVENKDYFKKF